jgi:uncharacterized membrane protein (UPF0136 family)
MSATVETLLPNVEKHILLVSCVNKKEKRKKVIPHILDTFVVLSAMYVNRKVKNSFSLYVKIKIFILKNYITN